MKLHRNEANLPFAQTKDQKQKVRKQNGARALRTEHIREAILPQFSMGICNPEFSFYTQTVSVNKAIFR